MYEREIPFSLIVITLFHTGSAQDIIITKKNGSAVFPIVTRSVHAIIYVDKNDHWLMHRAAELLGQDLEMLTGQKATITSSWPRSADHLIIIGSLDSSDIIKKLAAENKIQTSGLTGQWEKFLIQTLKEPAKGIGHALIITGSDKRGTAYAVFELSKQMGVSPWYWWADVPVKKRKKYIFKTDCIPTDLRR